MKENKYFSAPRSDQEPMELRRETEDDKWLEHQREKMVHATLGLVDALRENINNRVYDSILVDDVKARIHGLILKNVIKSLYGDDKELKTLFIKGRSGSEDVTELEAYLESIKGELGERVLFVTEEIHSGGTVREILRIFKGIGVELDISSFGLATQVDELEELDREDGFSARPVGRGFMTNALDDFPDIYLGSNGYGILAVDVTGLTSSDGEATSKRDPEVGSRTLKAGREFVKDVSSEVLGQLQGTD
ncbi:hypothetical protein HON52_00770 [Candidatus Uhrbacteria bacterium]|jgi:hypothetical protein|nr:hypothetical protein [Candidatus Uhrbacteria bacterium]